MPDVHRSARAFLELATHDGSSAFVVDFDTAPVLAAGDPPYRGIRVPLRFSKVVAWNTGGRLSTTAFVVDQAPLVDTGAVRAPAPGEAPPLGPFRTFQVPIADIAALTRLSMPELVAADRMPATIAEIGWRLVEAPDEILL